MKLKQILYLYFICSWLSTYYACGYLPCLCRQCTISQILTILVTSDFWMNSCLEFKLFCACLSWMYLWNWGVWRLVLDQQFITLMACIENLWIDGKLMFHYWVCIICFLCTPFIYIQLNLLQLQINDQRFEDAEEVEHDGDGTHHWVPVFFSNQHILVLCKSFINCVLCSLVLYM